MILKYETFLSESVGNLKKVIPFLLFSYLPNTQSNPIPNVTNNSNHVIHLKSEDSNKVIKLNPGEVYTKRIDGINHPNVGVYKVIDYVDELFGIQIYDNDIKLGKLPKSVNDKLGGGLLTTPPDKNWENIFNIQLK